jgi:hypothetical protein
VSPPARPIALLVEKLGGYASVPTLALIGGAAVLGITQRASVFAAVFTAELTHPPQQIWGMLLLAAVGAHWVRLLAAGAGGPQNRDYAQPPFKYLPTPIGVHRMASMIDYGDRRHRFRPGRAEDRRRGGQVGQVGGSDRA